MDPTEDLSARVLLTQILSTETPRTPFTRSASQQLSASATRRSSSRLRNKDAVPQTPKAILQQSQIHKLRKSISMQSLNATRRVTRSFRSSNIPPVNSMLLEDGETPRHLLKNILQTEPVSTPMVHGRAVSDGRQSSSADSSKGRSIELSGLDLPDLTIGAASTQKRLNRKRHLHFDVSAFEKRLDARPDLKENKETEQSSLTLSSPTLKTPFVEVQSERMGLRRRALQRRRISVAGFDAAVDRRSMEGETSRWSLSKTTSSEGFTLGLSTFCDSDITSDIIHCDKALCAQPGAMTDNLSIAATRDKPTVRVEENQMEVEQDQMEVEQDQVEEDQVEEDQDQVEQDQVVEDQVEVDQDQVEQDQVEVDQVEQDQVEEDQVDQVEVDQVEVEQNQVDQVEEDQLEVEQEQVEQVEVEQNQVEQDQVEEDQLEVEQDQVEQVEVEQDQVEVEQDEVEQDQVVEVEQDQVEVEQYQVEVEEDQMEVEQDQVEEDQVEVELGKEKSVNAFPTEGGGRTSKWKFDCIYISKGGREAHR
ncbi:myb-like protein X [Pseudochaenichthys georgianus]|uniref:myb-like protein X n=1 Tax=Pseudochaenichthys georgianus TaxID=52239 RepID=UPI0039C272B9